MSFPWNVYLLSLLAGTLTTLVSFPLWRRICWRVGLVDDPGTRKIHDQPIALAGGLAVFTGMAFPLLIGFLAIRFHWVEWGASDALSYGFNKRMVQVVAIFVGAAGMLLLGLADDKWELPPSWKFAGQLFLAGLVAAAGVRLTVFVPSTVVSYGLTILWILTLVNAFNFMDNMNGLCTGLGCIAAWQFGVIAALNGQYLVALLTFLIAGALLGFLPFNFPKASAFLGDAGSHLIGYLLAILAILPHFYTPHRAHVLGVLSPLFVLAVPLFDLVFVVILRWRMGKPFYIGDTNHLSHRLVRAGHSRTRAVLLIWCLAAVVGSLAFLLA